MSSRPQYIENSDGTRFVVIPEPEYLSLVAEAATDDALDAADAAAAPAAIARMRVEGTIPAEIVDMMLDEGVSAVRAWRKYRGMSQAELAAKAGLSQPYIGKVEAGKGYGKRDTRRKLAAALDAPVWALEDD